MTVSDRIIEFGAEGRLVMLRDQIVGFSFDALGSGGFVIKAVTNGGGEVEVEVFHESAHYDWRNPDPTRPGVPIWDLPKEVSGPIYSVGNAQARQAAAERFAELTMLLAGEAP